MNRIKTLVGNNADQSPSMFWEGEFENKATFELELKYGTVLLTVSNKEIVVGHVSDFPNVADVISTFNYWVETDPEEIKEL